MDERNTELPRVPEKFGSEAEMCSVFIGVARNMGLKVYSEVDGVDLVVVYTEEFLNMFRAENPYFPLERGPYVGEQLGLEAKNRGGMDVLAQIVDRKRRSRVRGPKYWGVLVPDKVAMSTSFRVVSEELGIHVASLHSNPVLGNADAMIPRPFVRRHNYSRSLWLPEVEIDVGAGSSSPRTVSKWKVGAVKLCLLAEKRGYLLTKDFLDHGIAKTTWYANKWIRRVGSQGRKAVYELRLDKKPPHILYPEVAEALREVS